MDSSYSRGRGVILRRSKKGVLEVILYCDDIKRVEGSEVECDEVDHARMEYGYDVIRVYPPGHEFPYDSVEAVVCGPVASIVGVWDRSTWAKAIAMKEAVRKRLRGYIEYNGRT